MITSSKKNIKNPRCLKMLNKSALPITYCANWITSGIFIEWLQLVSNNGSIIDNAGDPKIADDSEEE
ncbi:uncharacterized protein OCT59_008505 [Rhizophagus irregularis]